MTASPLLPIPTLIAPAPDGLEVGDTVPVVVVGVAVPLTVPLVLATLVVAPEAVDDTVPPLLIGPEGASSDMVRDGSTLMRSGTRTLTIAEIKVTVIPVLELIWASLLKAGARRCRVCRATDAGVVSAVEVIVS